MVPHLFPARLRHLHRLKVPGQSPHDVSRAILTISTIQQYLSVPVYTIFKNLTIILIAYGEVLWFGGSVTPLTLVSFFLMVRLYHLGGDGDFRADLPRAVQVLSSIMAASPDILNWLNGVEAAPKPGGQSSAGYAWMMVRGSAGVRNGQSGAS